ncbi:response regulator transcription factor [Blautia massiliensis (ex Durand et al. 2017)]|jgi:two-component system response regulator YesN|uniref:response regulator transcription factor n=1 Tax=Blautia massiliensis (ex Durand et al. 2017) TaxID=1737424 RepID=UPI0022DEE43B|nr:response regulator [Blautia massiliensis (ex Durand et al. 2017)]MBN2957411.1 response regulator [Blautia massiliensis (ex Durand et al. 2017)]
MRVIVVEDDEGSLNGLVRLLESIDPSIKVVGKAGNGKEGLELIEKRIPDVVITDIKMPVMDGLEMIRNLYEKQWKKSHFIIISSYSDFEYARQALRYQVTDYLLKPITYEEIETIMFRLMEKVKPGGNQISDINELYPLPEDVHPLVRRAARMIQEEYGSVLTLESIAGRLNISPEYLSQIFSKQMGVTITAYLKTCRIEVAKRLLTDKERSVQEVAAMVGYTNDKYFFRVFKEKTGVTPTEFKRETSAR